MITRTCNRCDETIDAGTTCAWCDDGTFADLLPLPRRPANPAYRMLNVDGSIAPQAALVALAISDLCTTRREYVEACARAARWFDAIARVARDVENRYETADRTTQEEAEIIANRLDDISFGAAMTYGMA